MRLDGVLKRLGILGTVGAAILGSIVVYELVFVVIPLVLRVILIFLFILFFALFGGAFLGPGA